MAIQDALATYQAFFQGFNARDAAAWAATLNMPHLRAGPDGLHSWQDQAEHAADSNWDTLAASGWAQSMPDEPVVLKATDTSVHLSGGWQRLNAAGEVLSRNRVAYLITLVDDHWGVQARFAADSEPAEAPDDPDPVRSCASRWLAALRLGDSTDAATSAHYPFVDVRPGALDHYPDTAAFAAVLASEDGNDITGAHIDLVHRGTAAAALAVELSRNDGRVVEHALLHLVLREQKWGIQARSRIVTGNTP